MVAHRYFVIPDSYVPVVPPPGIVLGAALIRCDNELGDGLKGAKPRQVQTDCYGIGMRTKSRPSVRKPEERRTGMSALLISGWAACEGLAESVLK